MTQWCRHKTFTSINGKRAIRIYAVPETIVAGPVATPARQLEGLDSVLETSMVALVNLYQQSVGGYIDAEARAIIATEESLRENRAWKWMFAARGLNEGETSEIRQPFEVSDDGTRKRARKSLNAPVKVQPDLSLPGSSKYLLFEQVPVENEADALYDIPSTATVESNTYFIAPWKEELNDRTLVSDLINPNPIGFLNNPKGDGKRGRLFEEVNYNPTPSECGIAPNQVFKGWQQQLIELTRGSVQTATELAAEQLGGRPFAEVLKQFTGDAAAMGVGPYSAFNGNIDHYSDPKFRRVCTYKLVAGTPMHATPITDGTWSDVRRDEVMAKVHKLADQQRGPFTVPPPNVLGGASAYDGLGAPTSSWFTSARFKAYMTGINRKRKALGGETADYDYDGTDGYVTDNIPKYEETAVSYPYDTRMEDLVSTLKLMVMFLVGPATETWYVAPTKLAHMKEEHLYNLNSKVEFVGDMPADPHFNKTVWQYHTHTEDWASLFELGYPVPYNPGESPETKMLFLRDQIRMVPRSKLPMPGWLQVTTPPTLYSGDNVYSTRMGCGFSEHVAHNIHAASDSLTRAFCDTSTMFDLQDDTVQLFASEVAAEFQCNFSKKSRDQKEFVLVPASRGIAACGEINISSSLWMIGTAPTLAATAARMTLQYVNGQIQVTDPCEKKTGNLGLGFRRVGKGTFKQKLDDHIRWYGKLYEYKTMPGHAHSRVNDNDGILSTAGPELVHSLYNLIDTGTQNGATSIGLELATRGALGEIAEGVGTAVRNSAVEYLGGVLISFIYANWVHYIRVGSNGNILGNVNAPPLQIQ
jgi:hypothetical protein